jgi:hypothetical protein
LHHIETNAIRVKWYWQHNHDPNSLEDMTLARAPVAVDDWLKERVESGLGWRAIHNLIRNPFVGSVSPRSFQPATMPQLIFFWNECRLRRRR